MSGPSTRPTRQRRSDVNDRKNKEIRDWARGRGLKVNDRGRIPAEIVAEYETENSE